MTQELSATPKSSCVLKKDMDIQKAAKILGQTKLDELLALPAEALKDQIAKAESNISAVELELKENESIKALRDELKETVGPFKAAIKVQRTIQRFCASRLDEKRG